MSYFIRGLAKLLRIFFKLFSWLLYPLKYLKKPIYYLAELFFRLVVFPLYKWYFNFKYRILNIYAPAKSKIFYILSKNYLIHILLVLVGFGVIINNFSAKSLRDDNYGETTIIYSLVSANEFERLTKETQVYVPNQILSYLDKTFNLSDGDKKEVINFDELATEYYSLVEGGTAIIKPNMIKPIDLPVNNNSGILVPRQGVVEYVVNVGETISSIARKFGVSVETVLWQNGLNSRSIIKKGDVLEILPVSGVTHKVKSGETVSAISRKYGISEDQIVSANNLLDIKDIKIGQKLIIPGGRLVVPTSTVAVKKITTPQVAPITKLFQQPENIDSGTGYVWPAGVRRISQYYSWKHTGLDIAGPTGTNIYAMDAGVVTFSGVSTGYGYNILIDHGNGMKTRYAHASKLYVEKGETISKGQVIMAMGSTGWSTGPHLHFEVIVNGVKKNPLSYIK